MGGGGFLKTQPVKWILDHVSVFAPLAPSLSTHKVFLLCSSCDSCLQAWPTPCWPRCAPSSASTPRCTRCSSTSSSAPPDTSPSVSQCPEAPSRVPPVPGSGSKGGGRQDNIHRGNRCSRTASAPNGLFTHSSLFIHLEEKNLLLSQVVFDRFETESRIFNFVID